MSWAEDRYAHSIATSGASLVSVEGTASDNWPASGPVQSARREMISCDDAAILTVGMAGQSHWSMSIEEKAAGELVFDVACRTTAQEPLLMSRYRPLAGTLSIVSPTEALLVDAAGKSLLRIVATTAGIAPPPLLVIVDGDLVITAAISLPENPRGRTLRWKYSMFPGENSGNSAGGTCSPKN